MPSGEIALISNHYYYYLLTTDSDHLNLVDYDLVDDMLLLSIVHNVIYPGVDAKS